MKSFYNRFKINDYTIIIDADADGSWVVAYKGDTRVGEGEGPDSWWDEDGNLIATKKDFKRYAEDYVLAEEELEMLVEA